MQAWINRQYQNSSIISQIPKKYRHKHPFPHVLLHDFLLSSGYSTLKKAVISEQFTKKSSDLFEFSQTRDLRSSHQPVLQAFFKQLSSQTMHTFIFRVTGTKTKGIIDAFGSLYENTNYLLPHDDQLESRKIAFVYYLTTLHKSTGGELCFYAHDEDNLPTRVVKTYSPIANSLMLFTVSRTSWHAVREMLQKKKRYAIGGWFHG